MLSILGYKHIAQKLCKHLCWYILQMISILRVNSFGYILVEMMQELIFLPVVHPKRLFGYRCQIYHTQNPLMSDDHQ